MKAVVRSIDFVDHDDWNVALEDPTDFCLGVEVSAGVDGSRGADRFDFLLCSPKWFSRHIGQHTRLVRHVMFQNHFDALQMENAVSKVVDAVRGDTWDEIAMQLSRHMRWEFEDYDPAPAGRSQA